MTIVMKGALAVSSGAGYPTTGTNITIGDLEEIHTSSGKMVMAQVVSSADIYAKPLSVSGNIVTLTLHGPTSNSGLLGWASASAVFWTVEVALVADGY